MEVRREIVVPASREEVWTALTEREELEQWFATTVELDLEPGGSGRFAWGDGDVRHAVVDDVEHERRLGFRWRDEDDRLETQVTIELDDVPDGTRVTVTEAAPGLRFSAEWSTALELHGLFGRRTSLV